MEMKGEETGRERGLLLLLLSALLPIPPEAPSARTAAVARAPQPATAFPPRRGTRAQPASALSFTRSFLGKPKKLFMPSSSRFI